MGIFGGLNGLGQMFDGKQGSPIEDWLRKNQMFGMQNAHPIQDFAPKGIAPQGMGGMGGTPTGGIVPDMVRRNLAGRLPVGDAMTAKARTMGQGPGFNASRFPAWFRARGV